MCKMEKGKIEREINAQIRNNYQTINWAGVDKKNICKLMETKVSLSPNFQYKGEGNYHIGGQIEFGIEVPPKEGVASQRYNVDSSCNTVFIKEEENGVEIEFNNPIFLIKH